MPYFIWKDTDSRMMGLLLCEWAQIRGAAARTIETVIPGRDGVLSDADGSLQPLKITLKCALMPEADLQKASEWLRGESMLSESRQPWLAWPARCNGSVSAETAGRWRILTVEMTAMPYRVQNPPLPPLAFSGEGTGIFNPGDRPTPAIITVWGSGEFWLTAGGTSVHLENIENGIQLNWETGEAWMLNSSGEPDVLAGNHVTGGPQIFPVGKSWMSWSTVSGQIRAVSVERNWRWAP